MAFSSAIRSHAIKTRTWQSWLAACACVCVFLPLQTHAENSSAENFRARADTHEKAGQFDDALGDYERATDLDPSDPKAIRGIVFMTDRIGAAQAALDELERHKELFSPEERRRIEGDAAAMLVRQGVLERASEAERYAATDRAIARLDKLIALWSKEGFPAQNDVQRTRFDRLIALRNRMRMQETVEEYQRLSDEGADVPTYALSSVAEAYLYLRQPEIAREFYWQVLEQEPNNFDVETQLFFTDMECDDYDEAFDLIDRLQREQPLWLKLRGSAAPLPNPNRQKADLFAAAARMDGGEYDDATKRLDNIIHQAPFDARHQYALGNLYLLRGMPRHARTAYEIGQQIQNGHDLDNETGIALADLDLQNFRLNEAETSDLMQRFPEQLQVQHANRLLEIHNMGELQVHAGYGFPTGGSDVNGRTYEIDTQLYSPPIHYNWRLFADEIFAHGDEPNSEGSVGYWRNAAGIEYRQGPITAEIAPTENIYHDTQRTGVGGNATFSLSDEWSIFGSGELFSRDTPIRALNAGITADEVKAGAQWRENESRLDKFALAIMPFSDGNTQIHLSNEFAQRLYSDPHWTLEALCDLGASESTANENRTYYNPSADLFGLVGARATQILYHRYETVYQHTLTILPGTYWEEHYGTDGAIDIRYENRFRMGGVFEAAIGVDFLRHDQDGVAENDIGISFDLTRRF